MDGGASTQCDVCRVLWVCDGGFSVMVYSFVEMIIVVM